MKRYLSRMVFAGVLGMALGGVALTVPQSAWADASIETTLPVYDGGSQARWPDDKVVRHYVPDPEGWVYDHAVKDGKPAFPYTHLMIWQYPVQDFIEQKLGCMESISWRDAKSRPDERGLHNEFILRIVGGGQTSRMALIDGQYLVGHGHMWKVATTKALMILDIRNRWAAFAILHSRTRWASKNEDIVRKKYADDKISLFLVDDSSMAFNIKAMQLVDRWKTAWSWEWSPIDPTLPVKIYAFRCDQP